MGHQIQHPVSFLCKVISGISKGYEVRTQSWQLHEICQRRFYSALMLKSISMPFYIARTPQEAEEKYLGTPRSISMRLASVYNKNVLQEQALQKNIHTEVKQKLQCLKCELSYLCMFLKFIQRASPPLYPPFALSIGVNACQQGFVVVDLSIFCSLNSKRHSSDILQACHQSWKSCRVGMAEEKRRKKKTDITNETIR